MGAATADFEEGQIWKYKARTGEEASLVYIVKIDKQYKTGYIFHIYVEGLKLKNKHIPGGVKSHLPHSPVEKKH